MILDSNILIYSIEPKYDPLRMYLAKLEVLGFHRLLPVQKAELNRFLGAAFILPITDPIITEAIRLRQQRKRSLADSIIAATCLIYKQPLLTNNVADFMDIDGLQVLALADILTP